MTAQQKGGYNAWIISTVMKLNNTPYNNFITRIGLKFVAGKKFSRAEWNKVRWLYVMYC